MDALEADVELDEVFESFGGGGVVFCQQGGKLFSYEFRGGGHPSANFIGQAFVFPYGKPVLSAVAGAAFQHRVQMLDAFFGERTFGVVYDPVDAAEVVRGFDDVVHVDRVFADADGVGLEDETRLVVRESAAFHVVGVVGQVDLHAMIDTSRKTGVLFGLKMLQQSLGRGLVDALRSYGVSGDVPRFARKKGTGDPAGRAVVPDGPFRYSPTLCNLSNRNKFHGSTSRSYGSSLRFYRQENN